MMFDFLKDISLKVYERYLTLEKNIKSVIEKEDTSVGK